jgi:WD40 repeat protein
LVKEHPGGILAVAFLADGKQLAWTAFGGTTKVLDAATGKELAAVSGWPVALSPDGKTLAAAKADAPKNQRTFSCALADLTTRKEKRVLPGHTKELSFLLFTADGKGLLTASRDGAVRLCDVDTGKQRAALEEHRAPVLVVASSGDGKAVATAAMDGTVRAWETATGKSRFVLKGYLYISQPVPLALSANGEVLATVHGAGIIDDDKGTIGAAVKLVDARTGKESATLKHRGQIGAVAFSPDGKMLAAGGDDGAVVLWDVATGKEHATLKGHKGAVLAAAFSPDGKTLATGAGTFQKDANSFINGEVLLWDAAGAGKRDK